MSALPSIRIKIAPRRHWSRRRTDFWRCGGPLFKLGNIAVALYSDMGRTWRLFVWLGARHYSVLLQDDSPANLASGRW